MMILELEDIFLVGLACFFFYNLFLVVFFSLHCYILKANKYYC